AQICTIPFPGAGDEERHGGLLRLRRHATEYRRECEQRKTEHVSHVVSSLSSQCVRSGRSADRARCYEFRLTSGRRLYSLAFNCPSFAAMNARISSAISSSRSHCSLYKVTGKRPIP